MIVQIVALLLGTAASLLALAFVARVYAQWVRAPFRNPISQFIVTLTDWATLPLRRFIPGLLGIDMASLFAAWLVEIAYFGIMAGLTGAASVVPGALLLVTWMAALAVLRMVVYLLMGVVIIAALLSWINPHAPLAPFFDLLARPLLEPVRRRLPAMGGIDFSPLVVLLLCEVALIVLTHLQGTARFLS